MKCLMKYEWVKLMRSHLPQGKGVMGACMKLASRAAFRKGMSAKTVIINISAITPIKSITAILPM